MSLTPLRDIFVVQPIILRLVMTYMITGAPISGVTALSGRTPPVHGIMHIRLQSRATAIPDIIVAGIIIL